MSRLKTIFEEKIKTNLGRYGSNVLIDEKKLKKKVFETTHEQYGIGDSVMIRRSNVKAEIIAISKNGSTYMVKDTGTDKVHTLGQYDLKPLNNEG